jgi:Xaa-Pro dipeptidase
MVESMPDSRRTFIKLTSLSAAAACTAAAAPSGSDLPASIAALPSMRPHVRPITTAEREARIAQAQKLMGTHGIDAILLAGGTSLNYFTGVRWGNSERLFAAVIPAKGKAFCVCPAFEEDRAREQLNKGPLEDADVMTWQEDQSPFDLVHGGLQSRGIATGTLGVEERVPFVFSSEIAAVSPGCKMVSATPVTAGCRMIKSAHELELMQIANNATLAVYKAVWSALHPGMTQDDAGDLIAKAYARVGFRGEASVEVGQYSALPHGSLTPQVIREGTIVMIDDGCTVEGYNSDITRTFVLGKATDKMRRVFDVVHAAQQAALQTARPGAPCETVDAAARKVVDDANFGPDYRHFYHRVGHGIGMDGHEWPYLVRGNNLPIQANMTFSDEPGIYLRGEFGVRLEDDMHITEDGAKLFTGPSASLEHPFA